MQYRFVYNYLKHEIQFIQKVCVCVCISAVERLIAKIILCLDKYTHMHVYI